jgi:hypothetical protein
MRRVSLLAVAMMTLSPSLVSMHGAFTVIGLKSSPSIKVLAVMLMDTLMDRFGMTAVGAANEAGLVLGVNEKTVRKWRRDFYTSFSTIQAKQTLAPFYIR